MTRQDDEKFVRDVFEQAKPRHELLAATFVDDASAVMDEAATIFEAMIPDMAYVDSRDKPMAGALFGCSATLAVFLALEKRGVDVHAFGSGPTPSLLRRGSQRGRIECDPSRRFGSI